MNRATAFMNSTREHRAGRGRRRRFVGWVARCSAKTRAPLREASVPGTIVASGFLLPH